MLSIILSFAIIAWLATGFFLIIAVWIVKQQVTQEGAVMMRNPVVVDRLAKE